MSTANEWGHGIMHCCTGNAVRAIYYIWRNMLEYKKGALRVNMLLNRASLWADVYSFIPYEGKVEIKAKQKLERMLVRVPEWIETGSASVKVTIAGKARPFKWESRYLDAGKLAKGERLTVTFPIAVSEIKEKIGGKPYTLKLKGTTVVSIDPPGKIGALYQHEGYLANKAPMKKFDRFVSTEQIDW